MEGKKNIYETINAVMSDVGAIGKEKKNQKQGFMYRGIDDVMNALNPAFIKHHLFIVPEILEQRREERQSASGNNLIYSVCRIKYTFYAEDGSHIETVVIGEGMDSGDKASNKAMAVAFKYACFQVFCIPTEEIPDPDAEVHETKPAKSRKDPAKPSALEQKYVNTLYMELKRTGIGLKSMLAKYGVQDVHDMTFDQWKDAMDILRTRPSLEQSTSPDGMNEEGLPWNDVK